jgi:hypothetical protein
MTSVSADIEAFLLDIDICQLGAIAIQLKMSDCLAKLMENGLKVNKKVHSTTLLHLVAMEIREEPKNAFIIAPMVTLLIAGGADQSLKDDSGLTARQIIGSQLHFHTRLHTRLQRHLDIIWLRSCTKDAVEKIAFNYIKWRALTVCIAMQQAHLPAWCTTRILLHAGEPFSRSVRLHHLWTLVTKVKHFK